MLSANSIGVNQAARQISRKFLKRRREVEGVFVTGVVSQQLRVEGHVEDHAARPANAEIDVTSRRLVRLSFGGPQGGAVNGNGAQLKERLYNGRLANGAWTCYFHRLLSPGRP